MTCFLLHMMEDPDRDAYRDRALLDVVGLMPRFYCAKCAPIRPLPASEAIRCTQVEEPCWKPPDQICPDQPAGGPSS